MSDSYSKLTQDTTLNTKWHGLQITNYTKQQRAKIKPMLDNFTSFSWRGVDAWDNFGAFIVSKREDLKFFQGPTWTNQYSQPQFSTQVGQLAGMTFKVPQISFTIGVYWFSEEEYRFLLDWLNAYEIDELSFGFAPDYYYQVKLASISQGTRYYLGKEQKVGNITPERYYTEIKITYELQGPMCAYTKDEYLWKYPSAPSPLEPVYLNSPVVLEPSWSAGGVIPSDIDFPIEANLQFYFPSGDTDETDYTTIVLSAEYTNNGYVTTTDLFSCTLYNLPYSSQEYLNLKYTSEDGLIFWEQGDARNRILSSLSTLSSGKRFLKNITISQFKIPGRFNFNYNGGNFKFTIKTYGHPLKINSNSAITAHGRTNAI